MYQKVDFVTLCERRVPFEKLTAFQFRKDRPAHWLQKACFFVLQKLGAFYMAETVTIERHTLDARTFMERLFKQQEGIARFFNYDSTTLLIGAEDYAELMHEASASQAFAFRADFGCGSTILGLKVHVIPWMRGCLVLPDAF
jgi:hypothetical protein